MLQLERNYCCLAACPDYFPLSPASFPLCPASFLASARISDRILKYCEKCICLIYRDLGNSSIKISYTHLFVLNIHILTRNIHAIPKETVIQMNSSTKSKKAKPPPCLILAKNYVMT